jgi:hypothetical protein
MDKAGRVQPGDKGADLHTELRASARVSKEDRFGRLAGNVFHCDDAVDLVLCENSGNADSSSSSGGKVSGLRVGSAASNAAVERGMAVGLFEAVLEDNEAMRREGGRVKTLRRG